MSFFSNSGVLASEAISGAGSKCIYPTECNVLLLTAIPLVCYLCYLVFPKGAFLVKIQRQASKYILSDFSSDYKSRLTSLNMLPLMMQLELYDILLFIKSLKYPSESFNIFDFVSFCSGSSRSAAHLKLQLSPANRSTNRIRHFYFSRLPRLWNYLPTINLEKSVMSIKSDITAFFWSRFQQTFDPSRPCTYHVVCPCARCSSLSLPNNFNLAVSTY